MTTLCLVHRDQFLLLLKLRYSSPLFRLPSTAAIQSQVHFWNTGLNQVHPLPPLPSLFTFFLGLPNIPILLVPVPLCL